MDPISQVQPIGDTAAAVRSPGLATGATRIHEDLAVALLPEPGHAFEYRGGHYFLATELQTVVETDRASFLALRALLAGCTYDELAAECKREGLAARTGETRELLQSYKDAGMLSTRTAEEDTDHISSAIDSLLRHQPMKIMLLVTQSCNLRCRYCYGIEGIYQDRGAKMSLEMAVSAVEYLFRRSPQRKHFYIYFFGGEPLLNLPAMEAAVERAQELAEQGGKSVEFGLTTNGTAVSDRALAFLIEKDFQICVSLDGDAEVHDTNRVTRTGNGSHALVMKGLRRLYKASERRNQVKIRATMTHEHHDPLRASAFFDSVGIPHYGIGSAVERAGALQPTDLCPEDYDDLENHFEIQLDRLMAALDKEGRLPRYNPFFRTTASLTSGRTRPGIGCGICRNDQGIDVDGKIYPCHRYVGMEKFVVGDVRQGIDREKVRNVYQDFFNLWMRKCRDCWARYACSGGCPWQASSDDGAVNDPQAYQCESIFRSVRRSLWMSVTLSRNYPKLYKALSRAPSTFGPCGGQ